MHEFSASSWCIGKIMLYRVRLLSGSHNLKKKKRLFAWFSFLWVFCVIEKCMLHKSRKDQVNQYSIQMMKSLTLDAAIKLLDVD